MLDMAELSEFFLSLIGAEGRSKPFEVLTEFFCFKLLTQKLLSSFKFYQLFVPNPNPNPNPNLHPNLLVCWYVL
jgi:hypothetical protein